MKQTASSVWNENRGDICLRNLDWVPTDDIALYPRRWNSILRTKVGWVPMFRGNVLPPSSKRKTNRYQLKARTHPPHLTCWWASGRTYTAHHLLWSDPNIQVLLLRFLPWNKSSGTMQNVLGVLSRLASGAMVLQGPYFYMLRGFGTTQ